MCLESFQFFPSSTWHHTSSTLHMCNFRMQNIQNSHFSFTLSMWKILAIVTVDRRMNANFLPSLLCESKCGWHIDHEKWCVVKPNFEKPNTMDHQARKFKKWYFQWSRLLTTTPFIRFASDYPCWWHIFLLLLLHPFIYMKNSYGIWSQRCWDLFSLLITLTWMEEYVVQP